jgi:probable HAF family extracellular repeat protein
MNNRGDVVGAYDTINGPQAFVYMDGVVHLLRANTTAVAISDNRQIVLYDQQNNNHCFITTLGGGETDIGTLGGNGVTTNSINNNGNVTGTGSTATFNTRAFLYDGTTINNLGVPPNSNFSSRALINNAGRIAVTTQNSIGASQVLLTQGTASLTFATNIGSLEGFDTLALGLSSAGQVTGFSYVVSGGSVVERAFLFTPSTPNGLTGSMIPISLPSGTSRSQGAGVNASGMVVGNAYPAPGGSPYAVTFLYNAGAVKKLDDLVPAGFGLFSVLGINDAGQILVQGSSPTVGLTTLILSMNAPEPGSLLLLALGGGVCAWGQRKRR